MPIDPNTIRQQFPCFQQESQLVYFDSAATAQVPLVVLKSMQTYYTDYKANVHRGVHAHTDQATNAYEAARCTVQKFLNATRAEEIIFTKNCTESINLVAQSWAAQHLQPGDVVLLSIYEHHSNIVPWLQLQESKGIQLRWWKDLSQEPDLTNVKLVAITGQSNVTGERSNLQLLTEKAHKAGAKVCIDAAQFIVHSAIDVQHLNCDFLAFSGHKLYGPTGIGVLYARQNMQQQMQPWIGGGGMISEVHEALFTAAEAPAKFEAGTPPIAEALGLASAITWLQQYSWQDIETYETALAEYAYQKLSCIAGITLLGEPSTSISFTLHNVHSHDLTDILGQKNIHLRAGHHCTQPLHEHLGIPASTRLSLALYNTKEEIDACILAIEAACKVLS